VDNSVKTQKQLSAKRSRPKTREKLKSVGVENLSNVELLALVLGSGGRRFSVTALAAELLRRFPLSEISRQPPAALIAFSGMGTAKAAQILAALELGKRALHTGQEAVRNPRAVLAHLEHIRGKQREYTVCLYLNARQELLHKETIAIGGLNYSLLEARDVFAPALRLPAASVILAHNHPSGSTEPSKEDLEVTCTLISAGKLLGITVLDHLIVTKKHYASLRELGHLDEKTAISSLPADRLPHP
jgi:DNA repair protein RadC